MGLYNSDARYPDASVNGRFYLRTDFLYAILSHLSGISRSGSRRSILDDTPIEK